MRDCPVDVSVRLLQRGLDLPPTYSAATCVSFVKLESVYLEVWSLSREREFPALPIWETIWIRVSEERESAGVAFKRSLDRPHIQTRVSQTRPGFFVQSLDRHAHSVSQFKSEFHIDAKLDAGSSVDGPEEAFGDANFGRLEKGTEKK